MTSLPKASERLPVRVRRILSGTGTPTANMSVYCGRRGEAVPLDRCTRCEHCQEISLDRTERRWILTCDGTPQGRAEAPLLATGKTPAGRIAIREVMTKEVVCVRGDVTLEAFTAMLLERGLTGAPVVDKDGFPIGMVSKTDLVREASAGDEQLGGTVGDIMTRLAFTLGEDSPLAQAAALMAYEGVHRLPIVSEDGRVTGMLSALDIARWLAQEEGY